MDTFQSHKPSSLHKLPVDVTILWLKTIAFTVTVSLDQESRPSLADASGSSLEVAVKLGLQSHLKAPLGEGLLPSLFTFLGAGSFFHLCLDTAP